jgi:ubiquitin-like modifier-activating enzyme ATG7
MIVFPFEFWSKLFEDKLESGLGEKRHSFTTSGGADRDTRYASLYEEDASEAQNTNLAIVVDTLEELQGFPYATECRAPREVIVVAYLDMKNHISHYCVVQKTTQERKYVKKNVARMDLSSHLNEDARASYSADLNLRLMRWRMLPGLDIDRIKGTKCLLVGAGTLGCYLSMSMMGWGFRRFTFVDSGKVSASNPVRQPLYTMEDVGCYKAHAASENIKKYAPNMVTRGVAMRVPMPGHPTESSDAIGQFETLVKDADLVFLLTDSKEGRWLPTMLGKYHNRVVINVALGMDTWVAMLHGSRGSTHGCYFCHSLSAPQNSMNNQPMDMQCSVTRPGVALAASAHAAEMAVSVVHGGVCFKGDYKNAKEKIRMEPGAPHNTVPQQIRGSVRNLHMDPMSCECYEHCTACCEPILEEFSKRGTSWLLDAIQNPVLLEQVSGSAKQLQQMAQDIESIAAWGEEDSE